MKFYEFYFHMCISVERSVLRYQPISKVLEHFATNSSQERVIQFT